MELKKKYTAWWLVWVFAFGLIEYAAIKDKNKGDTLSEHVRKLIGTNTDKRSVEQWLFRAGLAGLIAWLIPHFFTGSI